MPFHGIRPTVNRQNHKQVIAQKTGCEEMYQINKSGYCVLPCEAFERENQHNNSVRPAQGKRNEVDQEIGACCRAVGIMTFHEENHDYKSQREDEMHEPATDQKL